MKSSSAHDPRKAGGSGNGYQSAIASLQDRLLLYIRHGEWTKVSNLVLWLAPRASTDLVTQRYLDGGGTLEKKLDHKAGEGQKLVLKDILEALKRKKRVASRTTEAGEEEVQVTPRQGARFSIDPEFEKLLPRDPIEVKKLEERLLEEAPRDPLVIWKGERILVDGHTRYRIFSLLGRKYDVVEMDFPNRAAVIAWMYASHYGRRNYSAEMKSYVRGKEYLARKQSHGGARARSSSKDLNLKTAKVLANEYAISQATITSDAKFVLALEKVAESCGDEVRQKVLSREAPWTRRDISRLAELESSEMRRIVRQPVTHSDHWKPENDAGAVLAREEVPDRMGRLTEGR